MVDRKITELPANDPVEDTDVVPVVQDTLGGGVETRQVTAAEFADYLDDEVEPDADQVVVAPAGGIVATDAQAALEELDTEAAAHLADTVDAHDASAVSVVPAGGIVATEVQAALEELDADLTAHLGDTTAAHDARHIGFAAVGGDLSSTNAAEAIEEVEAIADAAKTDVDAVLAADAGWAASNVTPTKVFDADATTLDEVADVVGTLIASLVAKGVLQA